MSKSLLFGVGMSAASASFTGRKLGEKRKDLAILYMRAAQYSGLWISIFVGIIFYLLKNSIFSLMISDERVILLGSSVMMIISLLIIPQTQAQVTAGVLRGAGDNRFIAIYSLFISAILRPCLAYIFTFIWKFGLVGIWIAFFSDAGDRILIGFNVNPEETWARIKPYLERAGWDKLDAVKNGQVFAVDHGGLRSIYDYVYVQYIAKSLYPDLFQDIDPVKNLEEFYGEYLPVKPNGTFMTQYQVK
jgi:hypothetical protein